jgi:uncharacterized protein YbjT (DUF2867 family)
MLVVIVGGHGRIALRLARMLQERGDTVRSIIRNEDHAGEVRDAGAEPVLCDLEEADPADVASAVGSADAVVFAAGAGPGSGSARKETMDYGGAVKIIDAAKANGIRRYVMISSIGADASAPGDDTFAVYLRAKGRADDELMKSGLDYTIVRPTRLTDGTGDGRVRIAAHVGRGSVPRDDVAAVVAASLKEPAAMGKLFELIDGDQPVDEALRALADA